MRKRLLTRVLAAAMAATMAIGFCPNATFYAMADQVAENPVGTQETSGYVLMNIPYEKFYEAEGISGVDAVTSATVKTYNQSMAAGSYHEGYNAPENIKDAKILGVTYPVYVENMNALVEYGYEKITEDSTATITVAAGKSNLTTKEVAGKDLLFASGDYAYYVLSEAPSAYKTMTVKEDGSVSFGAVQNVTAEKKQAEVTVTYNGHYTDIDFQLEAEELSGVTVNAVTITENDGKEYALRHVEHIWKITDLGWNWDELDGNGLSGKTVKTVTYYVTDASGAYHVYEYDVNTAIKLNPGTSAGAVFEDGNTISVANLPAEIQNPKATVKNSVGRGDVATVYAENVAVTNGKIATTKTAVTDTYVITITSDNYADIKITMDYKAPENDQDTNKPGNDQGTTTPDNGNQNPTTPDNNQNPTTPGNNQNTNQPGNNGQNSNQQQQVAAPKTVKVAKTSMTYTGKALKPAVTVTDTKGKKIAASNYTVKYTNNKKIGTATVTVTFKGDYASYKSKKATFKIVPKNTSVKKLTKGKKQIKVAWGAQKTQTTGYQIQYSTSKKFTAATTKIATVKKNKTTSATIKKLKSKKTYYVRVRTYKTVGKTKYVSAWSKAKTVKTK